MFKNKFIFFSVTLAVLSCSTESGRETERKRRVETENPIITKTSLIILGTVQDAGSPHIACSKDCCKELFLHPDENRKVVSLGVIDPETKSKYLFEATPDISSQMRALKEVCPFETEETPDGIFLTHAHIGHYSGLMYLGKEAMNAKEVPVYVMPRMKSFLEENGPWGQLVNTKNIVLKPIQNEEIIAINKNLSVIPVLVPHRDEYSETVGFIIQGPDKSVLFIPDIDKWEKWNKNITEVISLVDYAFIDATFFDGDELPGRNIKEIPHPFIIESMELFKDLPVEEKRKIYFIHLNHTNSALNKDGQQAKEILKKGFNIAEINAIFEL